jgi:hypothetical protein
MKPYKWQIDEAKKTPSLTSISLITADGYQCGCVLVPVRKQSNRPWVVAMRNYIEQYKEHRHKDLREEIRKRLAKSMAESLDRQVVATFSTSVRNLDALKAAVDTDSWTARRTRDFFRRTYGQE